MLSEPDAALQLCGLQTLNAVVHQFWFQIAGSLASIEAHFEDETFGHQDLAALVASKVGSPQCNTQLNSITKCCQRCHDCFTFLARCFSIWGNLTTR